MKEALNLEKQREQWSSRFGFILSSAGAAIGLGAIWKFPYVTGTSGGGAFFLIFIGFTLVIGLPLLISEFIIGRRSQKEAVSAYKSLSDYSKSWPWIGKLGVVGSFLLLSFYSVVGGWVVIYTARAIFGNVINSSVAPGDLFGSIVSSPGVTLLGLAVFTLLNVLVVSLGVRRGIERANKYMMPLLFIFLLILVVRSLTLDGAMEGVKFFLQPDFSKITGTSLLYALGQSFFSLAVGFSCMVTYSSYLDRTVSIRKSATTVAIMNIFVSLLAGLAIFPAIFALGSAPEQGPSLLFVALPSIFGQLPFGSLFLALFLLLFLFATLTSSFSLYEVLVASLTASKEKRKRKPTTWFIGLIVGIAAIPAALSSSSLKHVSLFSLNIFDATDYLVSNILLPVGSLLIAIFISWKMKQKAVAEEFQMSSKHAPSLYATWAFLVKWIVPPTIIIVMLNIFGLF